MHGEPALPEGFTHFPYANPSAPKGGRMVQGVLGSFDTPQSVHREGPAADGHAGAVAASSSSAVTSSKA